MSNIHFQQIIELELSIDRLCSACFVVHGPVFVV